MKVLPARKILHMHAHTIFYITLIIWHITLLQAKLLQKLNFRSSLQSGDKVRETETESESDNKRLETAIDMSLAWTACTQFHLSPPSWMCFPSIFSQVLTSGNRGETDNDSNTAGPWIWNRSLSARGAFLCKGATLQLLSFSSSKWCCGEYLNLQNVLCLDRSQVKYFLAISMILVGCNVPGLKKNIEFFFNTPNCKLHSSKPYFSLCFSWSWSDSIRHRSNNNIRRCLLKSSSSVAFLWYSLSHTRSHWRCLHNKFSKLLNSLSREKKTWRTLRNNWTIKLVSSWMLHGSVGPVWTAEAAPGTDGWRTNISCLATTSLSLCVRSFWYLRLNCFL